MPTVAEILLERGRQAADARRQQGAISAQLWGGLANIAGNIPGQIQQAKSQAQEQQIRAAQLQNLQQPEADRQAIDAAMATPAGPTENGQPMPAPSRADILGALPGSLRLEVQKQFDQADKLGADVQTAQLDQAQRTQDYVSHLAATVKAHGYDPNAALLALDHAKGIFARDPQTTQQLGQLEAAIRQSPDPTVVQKMVDPLIQPQYMKLGPDETVFDVSQPGAPPIASTPGKPKLDEPKTMLVDGVPTLITASTDPAKGVTTYRNAAGQDVTAKVQPVPTGETAPKPETGVVFTKNGKEVTPLWDPLKQTFIDPDTKQPVTVRRPTPAAIQVNNMVAGAVSNAPIDASRPDPKTANVPDKTTGLTPNAVYQGGLEYALTGKLPSQGMGSNPRAQAVRAIIPNKAAAIAAAAGTDVPTLQAEYRANSTALNKVLPLAQATAIAAGTATDNLDLALQSSPKVSRTDSAWINQMSNAFVRGATPAANLTDFETKIYTAAREYAKVTSGASASVAGLTDSAAKEASALLNASKSPAAFQAAVDAMKADMANVVANQAKGITNISSAIGRLYSASSPVDLGGGSAPATAPSPAAAQAPPQGRVRVVGPNGETGTVPQGTALPPGWKAAP